jgi:hypothetical protein
MCGDRKIFQNPAGILARKMKKEKQISVSIHNLLLVFCHTLSVSKFISGFESSIIIYPISELCY